MGLVFSPAFCCEHTIRRWAERRSPEGCWETANRVGELTN